MSGSGQFSVLLANPSFRGWTPCRVTRKPNFTVSALLDCIRLQNLELLGATLRIGCFVVTRSSCKVGQSSTHYRRFGEREDAISKPCALLKREFPRFGCQSTHAGVSLFFCRIHVFLWTAGALFNSVLPGSVCVHGSFIVCERVLVSFAFEFLFCFEQFG